MSVDLKEVGILVVGAIANQMVQFIMSHSEKKKQTRVLEEIRDGLSEPVG